MNQKSLSRDEEMRELAYNRFSNASSKRGKLFDAAYTLAMCREPFTTAEVLAIATNKPLSKFSGKYNVSADEKWYGSLKNVMTELTNLLEWKVGKGCFPHKPDPQNHRMSIYEYVGDIDNPLAEEMLYSRRLKLEEYVDFCKSADGFMPDGWFTHYFQRHPILRDKIHRSEEGMQQIQSGANSILRNIDLLPEFFEWIQKKQVIKVMMEPFAQPRCEVIIHPHYLKEYNGRWYVYGYGIRDGKDILPHFSLPLDRIIGEPEIVETEYIDTKPGEYDEYFKNIIGVAHGFYDGVKMQEMGIQNVVIRIHTKYMYGLVTTKKFHISQQETLPFGKQSDGGEYGEITLTVEPNNELVGKILQMGTALEVMAPAELRSRITHDIEILLGRYK